MYEWHSQFATPLSAKNACEFANDVNNSILALKAFLYRLLSQHILFYRYQRPLGVQLKIGDIIEVAIWEV